MSGYCSVIVVMSRRKILYTIYEKSYPSSFFFLSSLSVRVCSDPGYNPVGRDKDIGAIDTLGRPPQRRRDEKRRRQAQQSQLQAREEFGHRKARLPLQPTA